MTVRQAGVIVGPAARPASSSGRATCSSPTPSTRSGFLRRRAAAARPAVAAARARGRAAAAAARPCAACGEGFAFLRTQPVLLMTFVVDIIAMIFGWPQAVFPELSQTRFAALRRTAWAGCSPASRSARCSWG